MSFAGGGLDAMRVVDKATGAERAMASNYVALEAGGAALLIVAATVAKVATGGPAILWPPACSVWRTTDENMSSKIYRGAWKCRDFTAHG